MLWLCKEPLKQCQGLLALEGSCDLVAWLWDAQDLWGSVTSSLSPATAAGCRNKEQMHVRRKSLSAAWGKGWTVPPELFYGWNLREETRKYSTAFVNITATFFLILPASWSNSIRAGN